MADTRVHVVNCKGGAEYQTITEAVHAAVDGDVIQVKLGQYDEVVVLDKTVHVEAEPNAEVGDVVIAGGLVSTANGSIKNVSVQQMVDVRSGRLTMDSCDVSLGVDGIRVCAGAEPTIKNCKVHGAQSGGDGIYFQEGAKGTVQNCTITENRVNGIHVNGGDVSLIGNKISECPFGIYMRKQAKGTVEGNTVDNVSSFGIYVLSESDPSVLKNTVMNCGVHCVMVSGAGAGKYTDNTVHGSVRILKGCSPTFGVNSINGRFDNENAVAAPSPVAVAAK